MLAFCCSRLMEGQAQDPYYVRVVPMLQQTGTYLAELDLSSTRQRLAV